MANLVTLSCGSQLAYENDGDPNGRPVFFFHGWPASRLQGAGFGPAARTRGLRLISLDRPGIGLSTFKANRRLLDWPPLLQEVADQLKIERFRLLAISGGAPYAFATAFSLRDRVESAVVVSGAPPLGPSIDPKLLHPLYRWLLATYRFHPGTIRWLFQLTRPVTTARPPRWMWPLLLRFVPAADREALRDPGVFEGSFGCYREAWRGSALGVVTDAEIYAREWGFAPESVLVPVRLWHGKADRSFSWKLAQELAARLPNCQARFIPDEGHYSLPIRHADEILDDLVGCPSLSPTQKARGIRTFS